MGILKEKEMTERRKKALYYAVYTAVFAFTAIFAFSAFWRDGKSLIWIGDGTTQHYAALRYLSGYFKNFIRNPFGGLPFWSWNIGFGSDIMTTLSYYVIGDPICLLCAFIPVRHTEVLFNCLIILRLYLVGIAFSVFALRFPIKKMPALIGSIVYAFMGFLLFSLRHPYFINAAIYLPLLFLGIEKIYRKQRPYLFVIMAFISAISNFYFFYILSIFVVLYAVLRFFSYYRQNRFKAFWVQMLKIGGYYIVGWLMAAVIFVPSAYAFLKSSRIIGTGIDGWLWYKSPYVATTILSFVVPHENNAWSLLIFPSIAIVSYIFVLLKWKKWLSLKTAVIVTTIFIFVPFFGYAFNGFGYIANRWIFVFGFVIALTVAVLLNELERLTMKDFIIMAVTTVVYFIYSYFATYSFPKIKYQEMMRKFLIPAVIFAVLALAVFLFVILLKGRLNGKQKTKQILIKSACIVLGIIVVSNIIINSTELYNRTKINYISEFAGYGKTTKAYDTNGGVLVKKLKDKGFYRVDKYMTTYTGLSTNRSFVMSNDGMVQGYNGITEYFSLIDKGILDFYKELDIRTMGANVYFGFDDRMVPNALSSVKYYVSKNDKPEVVPYGYEKVYEKGQDSIYKNKYFLPVGYTYDNYILRSDYDKLSTLEKQQCITDSAVVDKPIEGISRTTSAKPNGAKVGCEVADKDGVDIKGKVWHINKRNATVTLKVAGLPNSETYIHLNNIVYNTQNVRQNVFFTAGNVEKSEQLMVKTHMYYIGNTSIFVNMGYSKQPINEITIRFPLIGDVTLDDMSVYCASVDKYADSIKNRQKNTLQNIKYTGNSVSGDITLDKDEILNLSIPYSKGWTAKVNGKKAELVKSDLMYSAIKLKAGKNKIELKYRTPMLKEGALISVVTTAGFIVAIIVTERKRKAKLQK